MAEADYVIPGISTFEDYFAEDAGRYVVIGGVARELIYQEAGLWEESATKDLDVVLIAEALDAAFVSKFVSFVKQADYSHARKDGTSQMYRFKSPVGSKYPKQIELLCRKPEYLGGIEAEIGKVLVDDSEYSLSAILLDDGYYELLSSGVAVTRKYGMPTLAHEYLPLFKMRAYLNLKERRDGGDGTHSGEVNKHRRDVFRLVSLLSPNLRIAVPQNLAADVKLFLERIECPMDLMKGIGLGAFSAEDIKERIARIYLAG